MYGLALPRYRHEIVFKNAGRTARECARKASGGKVYGQLAAALH
jgi:hypothetical protein